METYSLMITNASVVGQGFSEHLNHFSKRCTASRGALLLANLQGTPTVTCACRRKRSWLFQIPLQVANLSEMGLLVFILFLICFY